MAETLPDPAAHAGPCVPAADLTAFAHGEFPEWRRAEISRHLLRCPACRAAAAGARDVLERLFAMGAAGDGWRQDLAAAGAALRLGRRRSAVAVVAGAAAAAVLAAGLLAGLAPERDPAGRDPAGPAPALASALPAGAPPRPAAAPAAARAPDAALSPDERRLLATQLPDGRWKGPDGRWKAGETAAASDEAATGLSLLALAARRPGALREGPVARAAAAATTWLLSRRRADGRIGDARDDGPARDHAIATAALLEVWSATHDAKLHPAVDAAVRDLARRAGAATDDADARWSRAALARARSLGWDHLDAPLRRLAPATEHPAEGQWLAAVGAAPAGALGTLDATPVACALRVLAPTP